MKRVALYGGSFNPPHIAHQLVSLLVLEVCDVDELWWVPTYRHAFGKELASWEARLEMCRVATARLGPSVQVSEIEAKLGGAENRTLKTLEVLIGAHPDHEYRLVIGADILGETDQWHRWDEVARLAPPIVVARDGYDAGVYADESLPPVPPVSSTEIRRRLANGGSAVPLVSRGVMDYIAGRGLYR